MLSPSANLLPKLRPRMLPWESAFCGTSRHLRSSLLMQSWLASPNAVPQSSPSPPQSSTGSCSPCHSGQALWTSRGRRGGLSSRGTRRQPQKPVGTVGDLEVPPSCSGAPNDQHLPVLDFYNQMQVLTDIQFVQQKGRCSTQRFQWCSVDFRLLPPASRCRTGA